MMKVKSDHQHHHRKHCHHRRGGKTCSCRLQSSAAWRYSCQLKRESKGRDQDLEGEEQGVRHSYYGEGIKERVKKGMNELVFSIPLFDKLPKCL